jgi:hypothetical protein
MSLIDLIENEKPTVIEVPVSVSLVPGILADNSVWSKVNAELIKEYADKTLADIASGGWQSALDNMFSRRNGIVNIDWAIDPIGNIVYMIAEGYHRLFALSRAIQQANPDRSATLSIYFSQVDFSELKTRYMKSTVGKQDEVQLRYLFSFPLAVQGWLAELGYNLDLKTINMGLVHTLITRVDSAKQVAAYQGLSKRGWVILPNELKGLGNEKYLKLLDRIEEDIAVYKALSYRSLKSWSMFLKDLQTAMLNPVYSQCLDILSDAPLPSIADPIMQIYESLTQLRNPQRLALTLAVYTSAGTVGQKDELRRDLLTIAQEVAAKTGQAVRDRWIDNLAQMVKSEYFGRDKHRLGLKFAAYAAKPSISLDDLMLQNQLIDELFVSITPPQVVRYAKSFYIGLTAGKSIEESMQCAESKAAVASHQTVYAPPVQDQASVRARNNGGKPANRSAGSSYRPALAQSTIPLREPDDVQTSRASGMGSPGHHYTSRMVDARSTYLLAMQELGEQLEADLRRIFMDSQGPIAQCTVLGRLETKGYDLEAIGRRILPAMLKKVMSDNGYEVERRPEGIYFVP